MKVFTKLGITILVVFITAGMLWAQSSYDIGPKKPTQPIASDAIFDLQFEWPVGVGGGEAGIETNGTYIYTTKWNGTGEYYRYGMDGSYIEQITIAGAAGTRDLAFDGTYFYGAAANTTVFQLDLDGASLVSTFTAPTDCRAIAYNEDDDAFYANNWGSNITKFDMAGTNLGSWAVGPVGDSYYGFAYDNYCSGTYLWGYAQVGASLSELVQMSLPDGAETGLTFDVGSVLSASDMAGGMCIDDNLVSGFWTIMGTCQNVNIWGVELCASGPALTNDVGIQSISAPNSGVNLSSAESVTVNVKNYGTDAQSNFDVWFTLDGGTPVVETISVTINGGDTYAHTFGTTVDLSAIGDYDFEACTDLTGDENTGNDCATKTVSNNVPEYCAASTTTEDEWIANVLCGDIDNSSGWQGGVADYTDISTTIGQGMSEDITITNGNAWASDIVYCWVDWNDDYVFEQGGNEEFQLTNVGGAGQTFTGAITAPADAISGDHRMRVRMTYSTAPVPCGNSSYGEVEDYTITVPGGSTLDPPTNFVAVVQDTVNVYSTWDEPAGYEWIQWDNGTNNGGIGLTSGGTLYTASHWFPADLLDYDGMNITKISFFANGDPDATYELMAWTGPDAGTQIMSQPIASFTVDVFNEITLDTPITIDASDELWFGYSCTHLAGTLPAGRDGGPAIANNGDMLSVDGTTWVSMFLEYGLDYNWNLAALVVSTDATFPAKPMVKSTISNISNGSPVTNELPGSGKKFTPSSSKALLGFNVYNNVEFVAYTTETNYLHENVAVGTYDYWATAVYDEGESGPSNTDQVTISGAPVAIFCDDFESYNVGEQLVVQNSTDWTTWSNNPGSAEDPYIIDQDGNAVEITGTNDLVYVMPNYTAGVYEMTFDIYIPTGGDGYFNTLQEFDPTPTWGMQVYFGHTNIGEGNIDGGAALAQVFTFDYDTWMSIKVTVDLDADWGEFFLDDVLIHGWVWSSGTFGTGTLNQLGGNNFFAWDGGVNGNPDFYFDNYCLFEEGEPPPCFFFDDFEAYNVGEQLVVQNSTDWTTWSNNPGSAEDPYIADQDGNTVNITGTNDLVYVMPNYAAGYYEMTFDMYVPTGGDGYFNTLQEFDPTPTWGMQVYFGHTNPGEGNIDGGAALAQIFSFDYDTWMTIKVTVDLDADWGEFFLDDVLIHGWIWSSGTFGTGTLNQLGGNNFFAWDGGVNANPNFYFDNYCFNIVGEIFNPPTNVAAVVEDLVNVHVSWDVPLSGDPIGYNVFRNDDNIGYVTAPTTEYDDLDLEEGTYTYCVTAVYDGGESPQACAAPVTIGPPPPPAGPTNLTGPAEITVNNPIDLTWDAPGGGEWIHWDAGVNNGGGVGLTNGGTFGVASRWTPAEIAPYNGLSLMVINFYANGDPDATYAIKVWTGATGTTEVYSQDVGSFVVDDWNEITLTTPVVIDGSEDFWFGYEVTHLAGTFPAGSDDGPAIQYSGDMILTGGSWESLYVLTAGAIDANWNIQGWVELADGKAAAPIVKIIQPTAASTNFVASGPTGISNKFVPTSSKDLESYNVYRGINGATPTVIGNVDVTEYTDNDVTVKGQYEYYVTAVWDPQGESDPSNPHFVDVITGIEDVLFNSTMIYPNPASDVVNIKSDFEIESIRVYSHSGQIVADQLINNTMYQLNTSEFNSGLYLFRIETSEGTITKRIIIQ